MGIGLGGVLYKKTAPFWWRKRFSCMNGLLNYWQISLFLPIIKFAKKVRKFCPMLEWGG